MQVTSVYKKARQHIGILKSTLAAAFLALEVTIITSSILSMRSITLCQVALWLAGPFVMQYKTTQYNGFWFPKRD